MVPRAIRGGEVPVGFRSPYDVDDLVGAGSHNIPLLKAVNDAGYQRTRDRGRYRSIISGSWSRYSLLPWMTNETASGYIYGDWIESAVACARVMAVDLEDDATAGGLYRHLRVSRCLWSLSAGWARYDGRWPGYPVMMTGARSWVTERRGREPYYGADGVLRRPWPSLTNRDSQFSNHLAAHLGVRRPTGQFGQYVEALEEVFPDVDPYGTTPEERETLLALVETSRPLDAAGRQRLALVVLWLEAGPYPAVPLRMIKTTECVACVLERSINPGSTCPLYAKVWYAGGRPPGFFWDELPWSTDRHCGWLNADPSVRNQGITGHAQVVDDPHRGFDRWVRAQRLATGSYYDELRGTHLEAKAFVDGWREIPLPGETIWDVRVQTPKRGLPAVEVLHPSEVGGIPPVDPPPVDPPPVDSPASERVSFELAAGRQLHATHERAERMLEQVDRGRERIRVVGELELSARRRGQLRSRLVEALRTPRPGRDVAPVDG